jgi:hypothetical protein
MWKRLRYHILVFFAVIGPGFITAVVDNDAGGERVCVAHKVEGLCIRVATAVLVETRDLDRADVGRETLVGAIPGQRGLDRPPLGVEAAAQQHMMPLLLQI